MAIDRHRRRLLQGGAGLAGVSAAGWAARLFAEPVRLGAPKPFSFDGLIAHARALSRQPYQKPKSPHKALLASIDYDAQRTIQARPEHALWAHGDVPFAVEFFALSNTANVPVAINVIEHGRARRVAYDRHYFAYGDAALAKKIPDDLGFAGFRLMRPGFLAMHGQTQPPDWLAFLGASYFRSSGELGQYGASARGVAVNTGMQASEPFPRFSAFWLQRPPPASHTQTVYALLEGEHLTGAYRFDCSRPGAVVMDIQARLFQRQAVARLGIAPLGSMYWYGQADHREGVDWRPEVHDNDGLAIAGADGARIWRVLTSPAHPQFNRFEYRNLAGFGLLQRDRAFDHYQDSRVHYERRPSLWIEPHGDWGAGTVSLLELPTDDEIYDNIVAFWTPDAPATAGKAWAFDYRLSWAARAPLGDGLAWVVATRTGRAGQPGSYAKQNPYSRKFVVDYEGGPLAGPVTVAQLEPVVEAAHGDIVNAYIRRVEGTPYWRVFFDWHGEPSHDPVELRCRLTRGERTISETWVYPYLPHPLPPNAPNV